MPPKIVYRRPIVGKFGVLQVFDTNVDPTNFKEFRVDDGIEKDDNLLIGNPFLYVDIDVTATFYTVKNKKDKKYVKIGSHHVSIPHAMANAKILTPGCIINNNKFIFLQAAADRRTFDFGNIEDGTYQNMSKDNYNFFVDEKFDLEKIVNKSLINSLRY